MENFKITNDFRKLLRDNRKALNLSQRKVADTCGISLQSYQRLECGNTKYISIELFENLKDFLGFEYIIEDTLSPSTFRISKENMDKLLLLQKEKNFKSLNETLNYSLNEYFLNLSLAKIKYDLKDFFEELILSSYVKEMIKQNKSIEDYETIIEYCENNLGLDFEDIKEKAKDDLRKRSHAKRY